MQASLASNLAALAAGETSGPFLRLLDLDAAGLALVSTATFTGGLWFPSNRCVDPWWVRLGWHQWPFLAGGEVLRFFFFLIFSSIAIIFTDFCDVADNCRVSHQQGDDRVHHSRIHVNPIPSSMWGFALVPRRYGKGLLRPMARDFEWQPLFHDACGSPPKAGVVSKIFWRPGTLQPRNMDQKTWKPKWSIPQQWASYSLTGIAGRRIWCSSVETLSFLRAFHIMFSSWNRALGTLIIFGRIAIADKISQGPCFSVLINPQSFFSSCPLFLAKFSLCLQGSWLTTKLLIATCKKVKFCQIPKLQQNSTVPPNSLLLGLPHYLVIIGWAWGNRKKNYGLYELQPTSIIAVKSAHSRGLYFWDIELRLGKTTIHSSQSASMCLCFAFKLSSFSYGAGDLMLYIVDISRHSLGFTGSPFVEIRAMFGGKDKVSKNNANTMGSSLPPSLFVFASFTVIESDMFRSPCCRYKHWKPIMRFAKKSWFWGHETDIDRRPYHVSFYAYITYIYNIIYSNYLDTKHNSD